MIKYSIEPKKGKFLLKFWEDAPIEGDRIKAFTFKQNITCIDMDEARKRFAIFAACQAQGSRNTQ